ncbi:MAG: glycosyltransferase family 2 protein [Nonlabens sp.]|uniref:glycosyltransferase family 2 protein n=1 Tax=Nonlabens sp. TaxID=1888209 RepID=UPI003EF32ACD
MIHLKYKNEKVTSTSYFDEPLINAIQKTARQHPEDYIIVSKEGLDISVFKEKIKEILNPYTIISSSKMISKDLGYIEDGPFINISIENIYPTWIKSNTVVCLSSRIINQVKNQISPHSSFFYWINSIAKLSRPLGVLNYQIPFTTLKEDQFNTSELYRFVKQHYKTRWIFLLLISHSWYEKRFPIYAFAKALFFKRRSLKLDVPALQEQKIANHLDSFQYDVVIPTMGRSTYLKDVLEDLNHQNIKPQTVIIVEQNNDENSVSDLDYLQTESYKFKVIHEFTHIAGACRARNEAISLTTSPWVLLFDDDVRIQSNFTVLVKEFIEKTKAKCITFACIQKGEVELMQAFKQWESFGSGCSIVHRDIIEQCKFDMALEHGYGEDVDYGMQIRNAGYDILYAPQIQILHLKAPVGGFRKPHVFPWQKEEIQPKPSPQIMYHRKKNYSQHQLLGYKMIQFFKTYGVFGTKNPWKHFKRYQAAWNESEKWASQL